MVGPESTFQDKPGDQRPKAMKFAILNSHKHSRIEGKLKGTDNRKIIGFAYRVIVHRVTSFKLESYFMLLLPNLLELISCVVDWNSGEERYQRICSPWVS